MIEVVGGGVRHAELLHHAARAGVARDGEGDDLVEPERAEAVREGCAGGFRRVAPPPVCARESPSHLHTGREVGLEARHREAGEADEGRHAGSLDRPEPEAALRQLGADARSRGVALRAAQHGREELHHGGLRVQRGEGREVLVAPRAEQQPLRTKRHPRARSRSSYFSTLPEAFVGSAETISIRLGTLKFAICSRHHAISAAGPSVVPGRGTTYAMPTSPRRSSATPITATCAMPGCRYIRFSISAG